MMLMLLGFKEEKKEQQKTHKKIFRDLNIKDAACAIDENQKDLRIINFFPNLFADKISCKGYCCRVLLLFDVVVFCCCCVVFVVVFAIVGLLCCCCCCCCCCDVACCCMLIVLLHLFFWSLVKESTLKEHVESDGCWCWCCCCCCCCWWYVLMSLGVRFKERIESWLEREYIEEMQMTLICTIT